MNRCLGTAVLEDVMHDEDTADLTKDAKSLVDMRVQVGDSRHHLLTAGVCGKM